MARAPMLSDVGPDNLFINLAEQVKLPFVQILHAAEALPHVKDRQQDISRQTIQLASRSALHLIDGYLLSVELQRAGQLQLEPVSVSSLLYDTAEALSPAAAAYGCEIELVVAGKYGPILSNRAALGSALANLGHSFIEAAAAAEAPRRRLIRLAVRRGHAGITAGVYSENISLSSALLKRARRLNGSSHQPMAEFVSDNAAGIFVADQLLAQLQTTMRVAKLSGLSGLAATFQPSRQLNLV